MEFMCAIRPDTETTQQTMRMLGTYHTDQTHADRMGVHIPHMSPGGSGTYHPDVVLTQRPVTEHPAWAMTTTSFGFGPSTTWKNTRPHTGLPRAGYIPRHYQKQPQAAAPLQSEPKPVQASRPRTPPSPAAAQPRDGGAHVSFSFPAVASPLSARPATARA